jgi:hypothetical protein
VLGLIAGALAGLTGDGLFGFVGGGVLTAIAWGLFGLVAGALYGHWAGRTISARRLKGLAPMLSPDTSMIFAWSDAPSAAATLESRSTDGQVQTLILGFGPTAGGALLTVG